MVRFYYLFPEKFYLKVLFWLHLDYRLNLNKPKTFNEKIQWLKLNDRNPLYTSIVDKIEVKAIVSSLIGNEYVIPTLRIWDNSDSIELSDLPGKFVLKAANGSGGNDVFICKEKTKFDMPFVKDKFRNHVSHTYEHYREWPYKNVKKRFFAEKFLEGSDDDLIDYKLHVFNGVTKFVLVCSGRYSNTGLKEDFFDVEWNHLNCKRPGHDFSEKIINKPEKFDEMLHIASVLAKDIPFVRVDLYYVNGKIYFSEMTLYPASGLSKFIPFEWDVLFGDYLKLPNKR